MHCENRTNICFWYDILVSLPILTPEVTCVAYSGLFTCNSLITFQIMKCKFIFHA